jgi:DNA-binding PadR family transcriptional regulator
MSKKHAPGYRDKRSKADLELFLLALIGKHINTPYLMNVVAGLSLGATMPALGRLERAGYLRRGRPGARGRTEFEVTKSGERYLKSQWRPLMETPVPTDVDAVLRIVSLGILAGADKATVGVYLKRAAAVKGVHSKRQKAAALNAQASVRSVQDTELYAWLQATHKATRLAAEAKLLRQLASVILRRT